MLLSDPFLGQSLTKYVHRELWTQSIVVSNSKHDFEQLAKVKLISDTKGGKHSKYEKLNFDGKYLFDKVSNVYHSATAHNEDQVPHLHIKDTNICVTKCAEEFGNPCENFCPAEVYDITGENNTNPDYTVAINLMIRNKLRDAVEKETEIGLRVKKVMEKGDLVSDEIILEIMKSKIIIQKIIYFLR